ncbi:uncharacterized protein B0T23DRAFT_436552 [Neurospora hispaniola]|uniref:Uncharacterized protein n=1 Tax=Neurospora hispaniola TaxID=588809 RepID=A0AAJ0HZD3_9PEZI|nr:hypothetical protein B0T23DRAFT_436552 [Neurospora hispaniola]
MPRFKPTSAARTRFSAPLDAVNLQTLKSGFSGQVERERMSRLRSKIEEVRAAWLDNGAYAQLVEAVRRWCKPERLPEEVREPLERLLSGYRDYADVSVSRPSDIGTTDSSEQYDALEMYCSVPGYDYLFKLVSDTLRTEHAAEEHLLVATTLIEFLTIDLYNLRLSQLGDPRYGNFEALTLTSADPRVMEDFATKKSPGGEQLVHMHLQVHTRGIDEGLLRAYRTQYPDSVVTSICTIPVANISPEGEREILLRGAFFQLLSITNKPNRGDSVPIIQVIIITINSNRNHSTESYINIDEKRVQRQIFRQLVDASKYRACTELAAEFAPTTVQGYRILTNKMLSEILEMKKLDFDELDGGSGGTRGLQKEDVALWLGGKLASSYPRQYALRRKQWHQALVNKDWTGALKTLSKEYSWRQCDWYNTGSLDAEGDGLSALHIIAGSRPPEDKYSEEYRAWEELVEEAQTNSRVWKTLKSFGGKGKTARDTAYNQELAEAFKPEILHHVEERRLLYLEEQLHRLMKDTAGCLVDPSRFRMPQLSCLTEMEDPRLWIEIPHLYGGFEVELLPSEQALRVTTIETISGQTLPRSTTQVLESTPVSFEVIEVEDLLTEDIAKLTVQLTVIPVSKGAV